MADELLEIRFMELSPDAPPEEHAAFAMGWYKSIINSGRFDATHFELCVDDDMGDIVAKMISMLACWVTYNERGTADFEDHILAMKAIVREGMFGLTLYGLAEVLQRDLVKALGNGGDDDILRLASLLSLVCRDMRGLIEKVDAGESYEGFQMKIARDE